MKESIVNPGAIKALNDQIASMQLASVTSGASSVTLASTVKECICYAFKSGTTNFIPINVDVNNTGYYRGGQYFGNNMGFAASVLYNKNTRELSLAQFFIDGTDNTSSSVIRVYIRS